MADDVGQTLAIFNLAEESGRPSVDKNKAKVVGAYNNGMAIFTVIKRGLMYEAAVAGQKFKFTRGM